MRVFCWTCVASIEGGTARETDAEIRNRVTGLAASGLVVFLRLTATFAAAPLKLEA